MILETVLATVALGQTDWPDQAQLRVGEVIRIYERTMSRRGTFENILVLTPNKAFLKNGEARQWTMLTPGQQTELKAIFSQDLAELRSQKRPNPMWPSAYDGSDQWIAYRVGRDLKSWTNKDFEYPTKEVPLTKFVQAIRSQLAK